MPGYQVLTHIQPGEGYCVNAKAVLNLESQVGAKFELTAAHMVKGWNLVATGTDVTPQQFNSSLTENFTSLWAWDNPGSAWYFYAPSLDASGELTNFISSKRYLDFTQRSKTLAPGVGFWVNR